MTATAPLRPGRHRVWPRRVVVVADALLRDPRRTLQLLPQTRLGDKRSLSRLSLAIHGRSVLADIYAAAGESGTRPFLMWGTLLGAIREGGPLAHDRDIDIGLLPADYAARDALIGALLKRGYLYAEDWRYKFRLLRRDRVLHIDFDLFYPSGPHVVCLADKGPKGSYGAAFAPDVFGTPRPFSLVGGPEVLVPEKPEAVLEAIYGPGWRVPDPAYHSTTDLLNRLRYAPGEPIPVPPGISPRRS